LFMKFKPARSRVLLGENMKVLPGFLKC